MANAVGDFLVRADRVCDYIPVVSTVNNLIDLFQKCVVLPLMTRQTIAKSHYYTHLKQKHFLHCIVLLVPIIGNLIIGIYNFINRKYSDRDYMLDAIQKRWWDIRLASEELKRDEDFILDAMQYNDSVLEYASEDLTGDKNFMLPIIQEKGTLLCFASKELRKDRDVVLAAVQNDAIALTHADPLLQNDEEIVRIAVEKDGLALAFASRKLQGNVGIVQIAVQNNHEARRFACSKDSKARTKNDTECNRSSHNRLERKLSKVGGRN